jgi:hypothetical protein
MASIGNNLYPPIIDTFMPAFVRTQTCRVYFSLSRYNDIKEVMNAQIIVSNQSTNASVLDSVTYPAGIKVSNILIDSEKIADDKYYVEINPSDLAGNRGFGVNQFYKVQIRFTSINATSFPSDTNKIASWLSSNENYFSEWSTVCVIKGIEKPQLSIVGFENGLDQEIIFTNQVTSIVGSMYYSANSTLEKEFLKTYQIQIYNSETDGTKPVIDSGILYSNPYSPNEINYTLNYQLEEGTQYRVDITYTTNNYYTSTQSYNFIIISYGIDRLNATITALDDLDEGRVKIHILSTKDETFFGNVTIRRTSSNSNFQVWEDIYTISIVASEKLDLTWYDYTVESGIWYKYCAQKTNGRGDRGPIIQIDSPIMLNLEDSYLSANGKHLKLKFDNQISSFQHTISETKTDTIGSQFPYIRRNGNMNYRQFPITGLITSFCDEQELFTSKDEIYGESKNLYKEYNSEQNISDYRDFIYEKKFRDKVLDFLYEDSVKLFRSTTEGNILVKLMDVTLTPNQTLGRMLYSFSANAYEIDESNLVNYNKYNIQLSGETVSYIEGTFSKIGQLYGEFRKNTNIFSVISEKYAEFSKTGVVNVPQYLSYLKVEFNSKPYLIVDGSNPRPALPNEKSNNLVQGYIVTINGKNIIVKERGFYELRDDGINITSLVFPVDCNVTIDYVCVYTKEEDTRRKVDRVYYTQKIGQLFGTFGIKDLLINKVYSKYFEDTKTYYQKLVSINGINVEANPGVVIYVQDSEDESLFRHVIGETGVLQLYSDDAIIQGFYFGGFHLTEFTGENLEVMDLDNQYIETGIEANRFNEIKNPIPNGVYRIKNYGIHSDKYENPMLFLSSNKGIVKDSVTQKYILLLRQLINNRFIYFRDKWYVFNDNGDVLCPIDALIDYFCEVEKGEYSVT